MMNLQSLFQNFNPSKFVVHCSLFTFTILFSLRLDGIIGKFEKPPPSYESSFILLIDWPYWTIFAPLWIWKSLATLGATVGALVWCRYPHYRLEGDSYSHFKAMLISLLILLHLILLMFELLACDRLTSGRHLWVLVFIPLIFGSVSSVGACIWSVKHDRSFELELFLAVNALQFVFLPLKLDGFVSWSWEVVFVPLWIVLCLSLVGVLYSIIFCGILLRSPQVSQQQRKSALNSAVGNSLTVLPILVYQVLLADKLDGDLKWPFIFVSGPLLLALFNLILLSFSAKGGNKWWFGIRKNFSQFLLCRILQEYGNISYHTESGQNVPLHAQQQTTRPDEESGNAKRDKKNKKVFNKKNVPVVPIISIDMPD